jgi:hypothetical protein
VTESVLGVTSPEDLKMTVPYFGDHTRFTHVSTHEMVHQFTIQKVLDASGEDALSSPIMLLPLWFIEGIAEWYTLGGLDVETDLYLRDLVFNPDPRRGYEILPFAEDRIRGYIPTYKLGQARIEFIAQTYGRDKVQAFLENAYLLGDGSGGGGPGGLRGFAALVRRVLNEPVEQVDARWRAWLKRRYYPEFLAAKQDLSVLRELRNLPAEPEWFTASPDGNVIAFRGIDRRRGRARVYLMDVRNPRRAVEVASDSVPGIEYLHPVDYGILALSSSTLVFSAQAGIGDKLYLHRWRLRGADERRAPRLEVGRRRTIDVRPPDGTDRFIQIAWPTLSADSSHVAFVGVASDGQQDVYVAPVKGGVARRLTDDPYSEKDLAWGNDGIYCSSDATDHARPNLFRIDPGSGAMTRLTTAPAADRSPHPQADGTVLFSSDRDGKPDLWLLEAGGVRRLTDFTTGLSTPHPAPKARGIFASTFHGGVFRLVEVPKVAWLESAPVAVAPPAGEVLPIPRAELPADPPDYDALSLRNWRPEAGYVFGGGTSSSVAGRAAVLFADTLRDNQLFVDVAVVGSFDLTQGIALYANRSRRIAWQAGAFHFVQSQIDRFDDDLAYYQRDFGVVGALSYPLDRFRRFELQLTLGAIQRYCLTDFAGDSILVCGGTQTGDAAVGAEWEERNGGVNPQVSPAVRFGFDTLRYDFLTGPLAGSSLVAEVGGGWLPTRSVVHGFARLDAQRYLQLVGRANFGLRAALGTSFSPDERSRTWERSWWISAADNLRGFYPLDLEFLVGQHYYVVNAELQFPLDPLIRLPIFDYVEGVAALDFGGVFNRWESRTRTGRDGFLRFDPGPWDARTLTGVLGVNVVFGPLLLRVHFGHPYDIGGLVTPALAAGDRWVTNVTLRYFFF